MDVCKNSYKDLSVYGYSVLVHASVIVFDYYDSNFRAVFYNSNKRVYTSSSLSHVNCTAGMLRVDLHPQSVKSDDSLLFL